MIDYKNFNFKITPTNYKNSRLGILTTPHGDVQTPNFIFCATKATIKAIPMEIMKQLKTEIILSNTYHLMIQPGADVIEEMGGLHQFMNSPYPMLTDSGGYQIFAMGHGSVSEEIKGKNVNNKKRSLLKITEQSAIFKSYLNGEIIELSPEKSIVIQKKLGADIIVQLDECTPYNIQKNYTKKSMEMSLRWGDRSLKEFKKHHDGRQAIYGVIQGGVYDDLRQISTNSVLKQDFFGIAIGGSLGKTKEEMNQTVSFTTQLLQGTLKPIHLLGIGGLEDIFLGVEKGIDTFDCVSPTRIARHGWAIVPHAIHPKKRINIMNTAHKKDTSFIDSTSTSPFNHYSRGYIHHLFKAKEILGIELLSIHNIWQMNRVMNDIREGLKNNNFEEVRKFWIGY